MAERVCIPNGDCQQYCQALDAIGGFSYAPNGTAECEWPGRLDSFSAKGNGRVTEGALLKLLGTQLAETLEVNATQAQNPQIEQGYTAIRNVFGAHHEVWQLSAQALAANRVITDVEARYYATVLRDIQQEAGAVSTTLPGEVMTAAQARHDHTTLREFGLVFDESTVGTIDRLADNIIHGRPTLLVGDKGIAKTKTAEFTAALFSKGKDVTIISGHGSMMSDELVGKVDLVDGDTVFHDGKLVQSMREGRPVILDEINVGDQQVMMRLQDILLKKPGQKITLQENDNEPIVIQPGFCVIATANEASARFHVREQLDLAFRDRFDIVKIDYPDIDTDHMTAYPSVNIRLALAHAVSDSGNEINHVTAGDAITLARLAHATQRLYSLPAKDVARNVYNSTSDIIEEDEPLLTDCITPRKMVTILQRVATGTLPGATIQSEMERAIAALDQSGNRNQTYANKLLDLLKKTIVKS